MQFTQQPLLGKEEALLIKAQGPDGFRLQSAKCNMRGGEGEQQTQAQKLFLQADFIPTR